MSETFDRKHVRWQPVRVPEKQPKPNVIPLWIAEIIVLIAVLTAILVATNVVDAIFNF